MLTFKKKDLEYLYGLGFRDLGKNSNGEVSSVIYNWKDLLYLEVTKIEEVGEYALILTIDLNGLNDRSLLMLTDDESFFVQVYYEDIKKTPEMIEGACKLVKEDLVSIMKRIDQFKKEFIKNGENNL
ncbi:MAG: hypothetical protein DRI61_00905 [Chloroflexi bacterium]|nr:MAG: hypothetical protein DRI61_00905 [Chloroflexota bacterium]